MICRFVHVHVDMAIENGYIVSRYGILYNSFTALHTGYDYNEEGDHMKISVEYCTK